MARVKGPLFSVSASGIFKELMEFRTGSGKSTVHGRRENMKQRTAAQIAQSERFGQAVAGWQALTLEQKAAWKTSAINTGMNGYQLYLSEYQIQNIHTPNQPTPP